MSGIDVLFPGVVNHLWQTTLFVALVALCAFALRGNRASVRHLMWLVASAKFLVPLSVLAALAEKLKPETVVPVFQTSRNFFELTAVLVEPVAARDPGVNWVAWGAGLVWLLGAATVAAGWSRAWRGSRTAIGTARPWPGRGFDGWPDVRVSDACPAPGVVGIVRPVLLLPAGITDRLDDEEMAAVIAHETAHARRRDNLTTTFHTLVTSIFWFHPFVWWIGRRLIVERERAADEAAVSAGFAPEVYAGGLLKVCRSRVPTRVACVAGVDGSGLKTRIEGIMKHSRIRNVHPVLRLAIGLAVALTLVVPVIVGMSREAPARTTQAVGASRPPQERITRVEPQDDPVGRWLEEVPYIVQEPERDAFESLASEEERERFIEQFWLRRDPTPGTAENEYQDEHRRRIAEANARFGYDDVAGWSTDRGRIYIVHGPPDATESSVSGPGTPASVAIEHWRYRYIEGLGEDVVLTFTDVNRTGEYLLLTAPERPAESGVFRIGGGVTPPRVVDRVMPELPAGVGGLDRGTVVLEAIVRRDGSVEIVRVIRSVGTAFDDAATEAIRQWRFDPGTYGGAPVDVSLNIEVSFNQR